MTIFFPQAVEEAFVPVIKLCFDGIEVKNLFCFGRACLKQCFQRQHNSCSINTNATKVTLPSS